MVERSAALSQHEAYYHASPVGQQHKLIADRALRAIDGLRVFADLPKPKPIRSAREGVAYHRVGGRQV